MTLTVRQLIAKLKKCDPKAIVATKAQDQSDDEIDGWVNGVMETNLEELSTHEFRGAGPVVVIRT